MDSRAIPSRRVSQPAFSSTVQPTETTAGSDCPSKANGLPLSKRSRQEYQIGHLGYSMVPYLIQDGEPRFLLAGRQLAQGADSSIRYVYQPEPALLRHILVDEIGRLAERLFFLQDLHIHYDPAVEIFALDFSRCQAKGGERCQLPMILGAHFLKNRQPFVADGSNNPSYGPQRIGIDLESATVTYTSVAGETHFFLLPEAALGASHDGLLAIHHLLLQRALGEVLYNQRTLERLQTAQDHQQQQALLRPLASFDRLTIDDPERLGFRIIIDQQQGAGLSLTLTELNHELAEQVWGSSDPQQLLGQVSGLLNHFCPQLLATATDSAINLAVSIHQLAVHLQQDAGRYTGIAFINQEGCILRAPFVLAPGAPWASPGGDSKTRLSPLLGAVVEAQAESGILPANLSYWHRLGQNHSNRSSDNRVFVVEPPGYQCPADGIKDQGYPIQEFDNHQWRWFSFADIRAGVLGERPLRAECSDIFAYLAFEQLRLNAVLAELFPGATVAIAGADGDLERDDRNNWHNSVTRQAEGFRPGEDFGLIRISPVRQSQGKGISQWLETAGLRFERLPGRAELTLFDNPYTVFRVFTDQCQGADQYRPANQPLTPYFREGTDQPAPRPVKQASLANAVQELQALREKLGVADLHRTFIRKQEGDQEIPLPTNRSTLLPLQTDAQGEGLYCDGVSGRWYRLKPCQDQEAARNEVLMAQLAKGSGLNVPDADLLQEPHNSWIISRWQPGLQTGKQALDALEKSELARLLITAAWLGNGNIIGCHYNHVGVDDQQQAYGLNWCGAGYYRGDRTRKQLDSDGHGGFFGTVFELKDLRDVSQHPEAAKVFASLTEEDIAAAVPEFLRRAGTGMETLVEAYGPAEAWERQQLTITLYERLNDLAMRYPDHLPRLTRAELKVISLHGLHGSQLAVRSEHIRDHVLTIGCAVDGGDSGPGGQQQPLTQISFRLTPEKTAEFADKLELGHSYQDLHERIGFFIDFQKSGKVMTRLLRRDIKETCRQTQIVRQKLQAHLEQRVEEEQTEGPQAGDKTVTVPIIWSHVRQDQQKKYRPFTINHVSETIEELDSGINALNQQMMTPIGSSPKQRYVWNGKRFHFAPSRVRSDWTDSRPCYQVLADGRWQRQPEPQQDPEAKEDLRRGTPFAGGAFLYRIAFDPKDTTRADGFPQPGIAMQMEFHGPDSSACALEGQVRLLVSAEPNRETITHVLEWLEANQLDTRRPDHACMQRHYLEKLAERTGGITGSYSDSSTATESADQTLDWRDYTRREGGRIVMMLPQSDRLSAEQRAQIRSTHNVLYSIEKPQADLLATMLRSGASLESFQNRVNQGQPADAIGFAGNIINGGANLVFTQTETAQKALSRARLIFRPGLFNRADTQVVENVTGQSQPWFQRHRHRPLADLITVPDLQFNLTGSLSLPEWLEHINVPNHGERQQILRTFREIGIGHWPSGQPLTELIRVTQSLRQQYDDCLSQRSSLSAQLQDLVARVGFDQFSQLLAVNPELQLGKLVSLEGIQLEYIALSGYNLASLCLDNCQLHRVILTDCQVVGADLGACDLTGVTWVFNRPEQQGADIDYLSAHLECAFTSTGNVFLLEKLLTLLVDTNRTLQILPILQRHGDRLSRLCLRSYVAKLIRCSNVDDRALFDYLVDLANTTPDILLITLHCAWQLGPEALARVLDKTDLETLCILFPRLDLPLRESCWLQIRQRMDRAQDYTLLSTLKLDNRCHALVQEWLFDVDHPALHCQLAILNRKAGTPLAQVLQTLRGIINKFPNAPVWQQLTLTDLCGIRAAVPVAKLLTLEPQGQPLQSLMPLLTAMSGDLSRHPAANTIRSQFYQQALALWPDESALYIDAIAEIDKYKLSPPAGSDSQIANAAAWALALCERGLQQFQDSVIRQKIFHAWLFRSTTTQQSQALSLAITYLGPDRALGYYPEMKACLPRRGKHDAGLNHDQRKTWADFYHQALGQWPGQADLHRDWITGIQNNNLFTSRDETTWVSADIRALEACQQALAQCTELADREKIFDEWWKLCTPTQLSKALAMADKYLGRDRARVLYRTMRQQLPCIRIYEYELVSEDRKVLNDFYRHALVFWPDDLEVHIDFITAILTHNLYVEEGERAIARAEDRAAEACQQALEQFADKERIFDCWQALSDNMSQVKALSLAVEYLGVDRTWLRYQNLHKRLPSNETYYGSGFGQLWHDFYTRVQELWPDKPEVYMDWITGIERYDLYVEKDDTFVSAEQRALEVCKQGLEQCPRSYRQQLFDHWRKLFGNQLSPDQRLQAYQVLGVEQSEWL